MADRAGTGRIIRKMRASRIGSDRRWAAMSRRLGAGLDLRQEDCAYVARHAAAYMHGKRAPHSRIYHARLSDLDAGITCKRCGQQASFYCNMNDEYFCTVHVVGHDGNES